MLSKLYRNTVSIISTLDLAYKIENKEKIVVLDTRSEKEYKPSHIEHAVFVDYKKPDLSILDTINQNTEIILYCTVGYRSEKIGEKVQKLGFKKVFNLYGGITQWVNDGYSVYNKDGKTNIVHGYSKEWSKWFKSGEVIY